MQEIDTQSAENVVGGFHFNIGQALAALAIVLLPEAQREWKLLLPA